MALPRYKDIVELIKKGSTIEAEEQILALRKAALELQEENLDLKSENLKLRAWGHIYELILAKSAALPKTP